MKTWRDLPRFTLLGRSLLLIVCCLIANAAVWIGTAVVSKQQGGANLLGIAILAWTLGLRHALDADHIAAIDNATRNMVSLGDLPITCGLFFSLGHCTIVIAVNLAIAISVSVYNNLGGVSSVGGYIGASVSASFLFLVAVFNSYTLWSIFRQRRRRAKEGPSASDGNDDKEIASGGFMFQFFGRVLRFVDKSWKMYPVGVLFGFGFDTASSIALLALSAIAAKASPSSIVCLPFLFTTGMTLIDSLDGILMIYAYARPSRTSVEGRLGVFQRAVGTNNDDTLATSTPPVLLQSPTSQPRETDETPKTIESATGAVSSEDKTKLDHRDPEEPVPTEDASLTKRRLETKQHTMSTLSIYLTVLSICLAFSISLITIMGLVGENCSSCIEAAENDPGLSGNWWRGWAAANDASGYIGAAIVGCFAAILLLAWVVSWVVKRRQVSKPSEEPKTATAIVDTEKSGDA